MALFTPSLPSQKAVNFGIGLIAAAAAICLLYYGRAFFVTVIISGMFAFILDPAVQLVMRLRLPRPAATAVVISVALLGGYLLGVVIWAQVSTLARDLPTYTSRISEVLDKTSSKLDDVEKQAVEAVIPKRLRDQEHEIQQRPQEAAKARRRRAGLPAVAQPPVIQEVRVRTDAKPAISLIYGYLARYFRAMLMASFVPFLVYFMLSWRDHIRKRVLDLVQGEQRYAIGRSWEGVGESTRAFMLGNCILGMLLSIASATAFFFLKVPYWPLVGLLSGFLSLFPYLGLPMAMLPPVLAALAIPNKFTIILSIGAVTAVLHVIALNFLYPKVVGRHVHLNPLVVTIALMFWTVLWGGIGLVLAIPLTAAIKVFCDNIESLRPVAKLLGD